MSNTTETTNTLNVIKTTETKTTTNIAPPDQATRLRTNQQFTATVGGDTATTTTTTTTTTTRPPRPLTTYRVPTENRLDTLPGELYPEIIQYLASHCLGSHWRNSLKLVCKRPCCVNSCG